MDPLYTLKRKRKTDTDKVRCFFCNSTSGDLRVASPDGKERTWAVAQQRRELGDTNYADVLERCASLSEESFNAQEIRWHKDCYSSFTSKNKILRIRKHEPAKALPGSSTSAVTEPGQSSSSSASSRRRAKPAINWLLCMFCQTLGKKKVHRVQTLEKSGEILEYANTDPVMRLRLSGVNDLIAAEGCYHLSCLISFERRSAKVKSSRAQQELQDDECMLKLCRNLGAGLSRGHVYKMGDVWDRYHSMCSEADIPVPVSYQSRRTTFYKQVQL